MGEFFNLNSKWVQGLGKIIDCVCLSLLWIMCCLPIVTAGTATTALYYTINKVIRHNRGYIWREYWGAFKSNLKQSVLINLILILMIAFLSLDCYIMYQLSLAGDKSGSLYILFVVFIVLVLVWGCYLFPYIARFENKTKLAMKNAALIAIANLPWTVVIFVLLCAACLAVVALPPLIFVMPSIYMVFANLILEKIFKKYMSEEDIAEEEERNREFYN